MGQAPVCTEHMARRLGEQTRAALLPVCAQRATCTPYAAPESGRRPRNLIMHGALVRCHHGCEQSPWSFDSQLPFCFLSYGLES